MQFKYQDLLDFPSKLRFCYFEGSGRKLPTCLLEIKPFHEAPVGSHPWVRPGLGGPYASPAQ